MTITSVVENLSNIIKNEVKVNVKTAWISPNDTIPTITIIQSGGGAEVMGLSDKTLAVYEFQVDIWAKSAKQRDELFEKILNGLLKNWKENYQKFGWWSLSFYRVFDIEEEGVFRKTFLVTVKEVV